MIIRNDWESRVRSGVEEWMCGTKQLFMTKKGIGQTIINVA